MAGGGAGYVGRAVGDSYDGFAGSEPEWSKVTGNVTSDGMIGRRSELSSLVDFATRFESGRPDVVLVRGEAGIGKSHLVRELSSRVDDDTNVLVGRCLDLSTGQLPYAPLADALRDGPDRLVAEALDALTGVAEVSRARLFDLLRRAVVRLAERSPTLLVIEDLHWIDRGTRDAILFLLESATSGQWGLVGTHRTGATRRHPTFRALLGDLSHRRRVEHLSLERLSADDVTAQVVALTGHRPDPDRARQLHRRSDGIPLLVEELVAAEQAGRMGVPPHLRDLYLSRLEPLSPTAADLVRLAAAAGPEVTEAVLVEASGVSPDVALDALEEGVQGGCLASHDDSLAFRHELLREAVLETLVSGRRRQLHAALARALVTLQVGGPADLAHHFYEAGAHEEAAEAALAAADEAQRVQAHDAVHRHLERVLGLWGELPTPPGGGRVHRVDVLARAAEEAHLAGRSGRAIALAEEAVARAADDPASRVGRWERLARYRWAAGDGPASERAYERAVQRLSEDVSDDLRVQALTGYAWLLGVTGRDDQLAPLVEQARQISDRTGDDLQHCRVLLAGLPIAEDPVADAERARDLALELDVDDELARAHVGLLNAKEQRQGARAALEVARDGVRLATARGMDRGYRLVFTGFEVAHLVHLGRWDEATDLVAGVGGMLVHDLPSAWPAMYGARLAAARGEHDRVRSLVDRVLEVAAGVPQQPVLALIAQAAEAEDRLWASEPAAALEVVRDALADRHATRAAWDEFEGALALLGTSAAADLATAAREAGRTNELDELALTIEDLQGRLEDAADPRAAARTLTGRAEHTRFTNTPNPDAWRAAVRAWEQLEDPYATARARWRLSEALLVDRSGREEARAELEQAWSTAERLGARPLRQRVEELVARARLSLQDVDVEPDEAERAARELGLTPREREVLDLVALGRTNKQIGEVLVISHRTVGVHVSNLLAKLGASRRTEAVELARRHGLLAD